MSIAHTWFDRVISMPRSRYGVDLVAGLGLRRARTTTERLYPHPPHQCFDMPTADLAPLGSQRTSQHPRTGKRILQVQPVETPHDLQVGRRHRARQIVDAATADAQISTCLAIGRLCLRSIIALRSAGRSC